MLIERVSQFEIFFRKDLVAYILQNKDHHSFLSDWHKACQSHLVETLKDVKDYNYVHLGEIGRIFLPYLKMGAVNTNNLLGIDELIILAFYYQNFKREKHFKFLDLGANLGFHAIAAAKIGYIVDAFEPDPTHIETLKHNIEMNQLNKSVNSHEIAVSTETGIGEFVHVEGNSTSSHLRASTGKSPYGPLKVFSVRTVSIKSVLNSGYHVVKMDVEGHEAALMSKLSHSEILENNWILEVGSVSNAVEIFRHISSGVIAAYSQKNNWARVATLEDMPSHYSQGSLVISVLPPFEGDTK